MRKRSAILRDDGPQNHRKRDNSPDSVASTDTGISSSSGTTTSSSSSSGSSTTSSSSGSSTTSTTSSSSSSSGVSSAPTDEVMEVDNALDDAVISDDEEGGTRIGDIYIPPPVKPYCSTECKGPRLIIKEIENFNFKSYAGKVVLGPFHQRFTAIIGPNGSGKSNVIDSMLFVFGYRANKIRSKKISSLLHSSARYPNTQSCSVAVHFCQIVDREDGDCDIIPNSEIVIQRTAFRDNTSYYTINGKRSVFKDVAKLLKGHNVDLDHNRFLILQGEVESIAMMKPKGPTENEVGMLEYLEDIVGTTRYKEPLKKISERVDQLTEERTEKLNRCKLAEREMNDLEKPYNEAVEYLRLENDYTRTKSLRIQKYISEKSKKADEYEKQHTEASNELKKHDEEAEAMKKEREEKEELIRKEIEEFDQLRKNRDDLQKKFENANNKFTEIQQTMTVINKRRKESKVQLEKSENELEDLLKLPEKNQREIDECNLKVEKLAKQQSDMDEELQKNYKLVEVETKPLIEKRDILETELVEHKKNVDEAKSVLAQLETEMKILKHDETTEKRKYESMKHSCETSQTDLKTNSDRLEELQKLVPQLNEEIKNTTVRLQQATVEEEEMRSTLTRIKREIEEKSELLRASSSNNKVVDFLMNQKAEGLLPGVFGRLGDLGAIDGKYDVAISTACGRLDNIIVDTVNTAQACIEALKKYNVGRASFIALEKVAYMADHSYRIQTPENANRLYDLIHVEDDRVLPAFYFALRNTLVANDMDQARRIAYGQQRFRVVTLTGGVIETSGTMSGGGKQMIRGKMCDKVQTKTNKSDDTSLASKKDIEDMQIKAEELQTKVNYCQQEQSRLEKDMTCLKTTKQKNESEMQKLAIGTKSLEEQIRRVLKQVEEQKKRMEETTTDPAKVKALEDDIDEKKKDLKIAEDAAGKVTKKINEIKLQIEKLHGEKVKSVQSKITSINNQMKKLNNNITKLQVEITSCERNVKKMENQIDNLKSSVLKAQEELTQLGEERKMYDNQTAEYEKLKTEADAAIEKAKSCSSDIQKEIHAIQKKENESKLKRVEIEQNWQALGQKLAEVRSHIPKLRALLKPLKLNEIPGDAEPQPPFKEYSEEELDGHSLTDLQYKESVLEEKLKTKPNLSIINEYIEKKNVYLQRVKVLEDVSSRRNEMRQLYDDVRKKRYDEFMAGYQIITRKLKEMYQMITQGGDADLELVDTLDPFTEGVSFSVRPPKKSWKNISNLSGGEKTLSSLALVFALHYYKPSPLYFMDEIDAALDFKNVSIVAHYIKERTRNAQFIIISLRTNMFELGDRLVGIYKVKDCTNSITITNFQIPKALPPLTQTMNIRPSGNPDFSFTVNSSYSSFHGNELADAAVSQPKQIKLVDPLPILMRTSPTIIDDNAKENNDINSEPIASTSAQARESMYPLTQDNALFPLQGRETTFAPNSELQSTAQSFLIEQTSTSIRNSATNASNTIINDGIFKKPLPPPPPRVVNV